MKKVVLPILGIAAFVVIGAALSAGSDAQPTIGTSSGSISTVTSSPCGGYSAAAGGRWVPAPCSTTTTVGTSTVDHGFRVTGCEVEYGYATASGTITNNGGLPSKFRVTVDFKDASGVRLEQDYTLVPTVPAGATSRWEVMGRIGDSYARPVTCSAGLREGYF